jgi:exopolysaccharide biosynthesis polyprenyl glycosylphosphotransferase
MLKQYKKQLLTLFKVIDVLIILCSFYLAYYLRFRSLDLNLLTLQKQFLIFLPTYFVAWFYLCKRFKLYSSKRFVSFKVEAFDAWKTITLSVFAASIPAFFIRDYPLSRIFIVNIWLLQTALILSSRFMLRELLKYFRRRGYNFRQILIVGRNDRTAKFVDRIEESPEFGLRILGFIDAPNKHNGHEFSSTYRYLGGLRELERIIREQVVDEVFIFLPIKSFYSEIQGILHVCEIMGVEVKIPTDLFSYKLAKSVISVYDDISVIDLYTSPKMNWQLLVKRFIDLFCSGFGLIILAPLFVVVSLFIKATSKGPIFFKQERVGYNGRLFNCLKFRTMLENAEELKNDLLKFNEMDGPVFKIKNDPRVTRVGRILRKTSIDELPQLINVFKGEMSLVGPRPPVPSEVVQYDLKDRRRLSMRPGITCLWQVNGRNAVPFEKWMELDRQYIDQWSLWLDFKILAKTVPSVMRGSGAA